MFHVIILVYLKKVLQISSLGSKRFNFILNGYKTFIADNKDNYN